MAGLLLVASTASAGAQESGWSYSPYPGEGDRAALGCAYGSTPDDHTCIAVRCADDFSVTLHIDTSRVGGDAGRWSLSVDEDSTFPVTATSDPSEPYGARVDGDVAPIIEAIRHGNAFFLDPLDGKPAPSRGIGLAGSLQAINKALYFCAPRVVPQATEKETDK